MSKPDLSSLEKSVEAAFEARDGISAATRGEAREARRTRGHGGGRWGRGLFCNLRPPGPRGPGCLPTMPAAARRRAADTSGYESRLHRRAVQ